MVTTPQLVVKNAIDYFVSIVGGVSGVTVEEVERSEDGRQWLVTLSGWVRESKPQSSELSGIPNQLADIFRSEHTQIFRRFHVDDETGEVTAMRLRKWD